MGPLAGERYCAIAIRRRFFFVLFGAIIFTVACGRGSGKNLSVEGVWVDKERPTARFEFRRDGTGRLTDNCSPINTDV